ncbi:MAG: DKNYY domain-containing protein [Flavobacteriaceae bacterium]|nr:DKNYY domain-containing protein [Flavobacteriaceae bacterium]
MKRLLSYISFLLSLFSFTGCQNNSGYEEKNGKVYYKWVNGGNYKTEYTLVEAANPTTFEVIKQNLKVHLARDENHVFINAKVIDGADPSSFEQIKDYYWRDKNQVFLLSTDDQKYHVIDGADPDSFEVIVNHYWSKDKLNVFYSATKLPDVSSSEFEAIDNHWGKDNDHYYYHSFRLGLLDYRTAEIINAYYIKDKDQVFFGNKLVQGADPKTFQVNKLEYFGHDDKNMFQWEKNKGPITEEYKNTYIDK